MVHLQMEHQTRTCTFRVLLLLVLPRRLQQQQWQLPICCSNPTLLCFLLLSSRFLLSRRRRLLQSSRYPQFQRSSRQIVSRELMLGQPRGEPAFQPTPRGRRAAAPCPVAARCPSWWTPRGVSPGRPARDPRPPARPRGLSHGGPGTPHAASQRKKFAGYVRLDGNALSAAVLLGWFGRAACTPRWPRRRRRLRRRCGSWPARPRTGGTE